MIDPTDITKFDRTDDELEEFFLFSVAVAGKTAKVITKKIDQFLSLERENVSPFEKIRRMLSSYSLLMNLKRVKLGKYAILTECYKKIALSQIDLRTCSLEDLEQFKGVGPKTSRFFVLHSRPDQKIACLDTHILSYLKDLGYDIPKSNPTGNRYLKIEQMFLEHAKSLNRDPAELDLAIWNERSVRSGTISK
jgi:thermostable 8-oxoguanine DNA glycosylase